ncbi:MAG: CPBP family intramembrane metalloprotease, partial [Anaerolineales bacterium]
KVESVFSTVVVIGIGFPLAWDGLSKDWQSLSFFKRNVKEAVFWGIATGVISSLVGLIVVRGHEIPGNLGKQLLLGIPFWLLIISPFQEFFFRGWLQTRLSDSLGKWAGLLLANICFTAWHYLSPIIDQASFPLSSWAGLGSTFIVGLLYGYSFQRSNNVIAPWLVHTISGITFVAVGAMDLFQVMN